MSFEDGVYADNVAAIRAMGIRPRRRRASSAKAFAEQIFVHGRVPLRPPRRQPVACASAQGRRARTPQLVLLDHGLYRSIPPTCASPLSELPRAVLAGGRSPACRKQSSAWAPAACSSSGPPCSPRATGTESWPPTTTSDSLTGACFMACVAWRGVAWRGMVWRGVAWVETEGEGRERELTCGTERQHGQAWGAVRTRRRRCVRPRGAVHRFQSGCAHTRLPGVACFFAAHAR
jgi:hypothetical protein